MKTSLGVVCNAIPSCTCGAEMAAPGLLLFFVMIFNHLFR